MPTPAGASLLPALLPVVTILGAGLAASSAAGETSGLIKEAISRELPRYDPAAYARAQAERAARAAPKNAPGPVPDTPPAPPAAAAAKEGVLELPKVTVHGETPPPLPLPRVQAPPIVRDLQGEPFESPSARSARLIKRHTTLLDQIMNHFTLPLFGTSLASRAAQASADEKRAGKLDNLATLIELDAAAGRDPEEVEKLRAAYSRIYLDSR